MPSYSQDGEFHGVSYITGPAHVFLQLAFSSAPVKRSAFKMEILPPLTASPQVSLDVGAITEAVIDAAAKENARLGTAFFPSAARYVADDTPHRPLYEHCTRLLIRRMANRSFHPEPD